MCVNSHDYTLSHWTKLEVTVVSSGPKVLLSDVASGPEQEIVEEGIWTVAVSIGFCMRNCNRCCY